MDTERREGQPSVSVVIPVYRSARTLEPLVNGIRDVLTRAGEECEVVLVDDASPDPETGKVLTSLARLPGVRVLRLRRNRGQHVATVVGLSSCRGELAVTMDDDLQHDPRHLPDLLRTLRASGELDAVVARFPESRHALHRRIGSRVVGRVVRWSNALPPDFAFTSYLVMRSDVRELVVAAASSTSRPVVGLLLAASTHRVVNLDVQHEPRPEGASNWRPGRLITLTLQLAQAALFTERGSRLLSGVSVTAGLSALVLLLFYIARFIRLGIPPSGFTTTVALILGTFALSSFLISALLLGLADLRESTWRSISMEIRSDSWGQASPIPQMESGSPPLQEG